MQDPTQSVDIRTFSPKIFPNQWITPALQNPPHESQLSINRKHPLQTIKTSLIWCLLLRRAVSKDLQGLLLFLRSFWMRRQQVEEASLNSLIWRGLRLIIRWKARDSNSEEEWIHSVYVTQTAVRQSNSRNVEWQMETRVMHTEESYT